MFQCRGLSTIVWLNLIRNTIKRSTVIFFRFYFVTIFYFLRDLLTGYCIYSYFFLFSTTTCLKDKMYIYIILAVIAALSL